MITQARHPGCYQATSKFLANSSETSIFADVKACFGFPVCKKSTGESMGFTYLVPNPHYGEQAAP